MTIVGMVVAVVGLFCFYVAFLDKDKINFVLGTIFVGLALVLMYCGSFGKPAKCAVGYYKIFDGVIEGKEVYFMARGVSDGTDKSTKFCRVPFKNVHTLQWQNVYVWLIDGTNGQELYLSPPSVEVDTD